MAKLGQTGLLEGCHVGPTGQAATRRRAAADGSFMGHQFFNKLLLKYGGGFLFSAFSARVRLCTTFSTEARQADVFNPDTESQKDEAESRLPAQALDRRGSVHINTNGFQTFALTTTTASFRYQSREETHTKPLICSFRRPIHILHNAACTKKALNHSTPHLHFLDHLESSDCF